MVNLREKDYKIFMSRREGRYFILHSANTTRKMSHPTNPIAYFSEERTATNLRNWRDWNNQIEITYHSGGKEVRR